MKIVKQIQLKIGIFTAVKNLCILHRHDFVIESDNPSSEEGER